MDWPTAFVPLAGFAQAYRAVRRPQGLTRLPRQPAPASCITSPWPRRALGTAMLILLLGPSLSAYSATSHVPADYGTIQCAVDSVSSGDEIVVAPGIYFESILLPDAKDVVLRSENPDNPAFVMQTILDGSNRQSVVLATLQSAATVIEGFRIQRGNGQNGGGGIWAKSRPIVIRNNVILNNRCSPIDDLRCLGAGIRGSTGTIEHNVIIDNFTTNGLYCFDDGSDIPQCIDLLGEGGGISTSNALISRNIIARNSDSGKGDALFSTFGTLRNNLIVDHEGTALYGCGGTIENNEIARNRVAAESGSADYNHNYIHSNVWQAIDVGLTNLGVRRGTATGNFIYGNGGRGISGMLSVDGNVIINNSSAIQFVREATNNLIANTEGGGLLDIDDAAYHNVVYNAWRAVYRSENADIANNIFWNNTDPEPVALPGHQLRYNIVQDHDHGDGTNVVADPLFVDAENLDFRLQSGSPAIDGGVLLAGVTSDILGTARGMDGGGSGGDGSNYDIGAVEFVPEGESEGAATESDAFFAALAAGNPPPGVGILDPPTWPDWVWQPDVPVPDEVVFPAVYHHTDQDEDGLISLSELLRSIQFFNSAGYRCQPGTEDGWAPAANQGDTCCQRHHGDYNPPDYTLSLSELLRIIQHYNVGLPLYLCGDSEDGFCGGSR